MRLLILLLATSAITGCVNNSTNTALDVGSDQVQLRQIQSRAFDTTDKAKTLRTVIAVLQDLGFVIDKADLELGTVTATKLDGYALRMSVSARSRKPPRAARDSRRMLAVFHCWLSLFWPTGMKNSMARCDTTRPVSSWMGRNDTTR